MWLRLNICDLPQHPPETNRLNPEKNAPKEAEEEVPKQRSSSAARVEINFIILAGSFSFVAPMNQQQGD